jgi:hypothetical protein
MNRMQRLPPRGDGNKGQSRRATRDLKNTGRDRNHGAWTREKLQLWVQVDAQRGPYSGPRTRRSRHDKRKALQGPANDCQAILEELLLWKDPPYWKEGPSRIK